MYLPAQKIKDLCRNEELITPFHKRSVINGRAFGLSSSGYDVRLKQTLWVFPLWGRLGSTIEHFKMPNNLVAFVKDKSSNARLFLTVQNTVIEPGWRGYLTLEITNHRFWPRRLKAGTPIAQILFARLDGETDQPYRW